MSAAAPLPREPIYATAAMLGHPLRSPVEIEPFVEYRAACNCHWWQMLDPVEAQLAMGGWQ